MKKYLILLVAFVSVFVACERSGEGEIEFPGETGALIDGEDFVPSKSLVIKAGGRYVVSFKNENERIEIITNDTVSGIYAVSEDGLNVSGLMSAGLSYTNGNKIFKGVAGEIEILKDKSGGVAGKYNARVSDDVISIDIDSGSFIVIQPEIASALIENEAAISEAIDGCYSDFCKYIEFAYVFDGVYSKKISLPGASWTELYEHNCPDRMPEA